MNYLLKTETDFSSNLWAIAVILIGYFVVRAIARIPKKTDRQLADLAYNQIVKDLAYAETIQDMWRIEEMVAAFKKMHAPRVFDGAALASTLDEVFNDRYDTILMSGKYSVG